MSDKKRLSWIDYGRGLCMLFVILYHSQVYYTGGFGSSYIYTPFFLTFFFFISGYLFDAGSFSARRKIASLVRAVIIPYFIFTSLLWLPKAIAHGNDIGLANGLIDIFGGYASWFVAALVVAQLIFIAIRKITGSLPVIWIMGIGCMLCSFVLRHYLPAPSPWYFVSGLAALFYVILGYTFRIYENLFTKILHSKAMLVLSVVLYAGALVVEKYCVGWYVNIFPENGIVDNPASYFILSLLGIFMMLNITYRLPPKIGFLQYVGRYSLVFYFLNGGVILTLSKLTSKYNVFAYNGHFWQVLLIAVLTTVILYLACKVIVRFFPWAIGDKESINRIKNAVVTRRKN